MIVDTLDLILAKYVKGSNNRIGRMKKQINLNKEEINKRLIVLKIDAKIKEKAIEDMKEAKECAHAEMLSY